MKQFSLSGVFLQYPKRDVNNSIKISGTRYNEILCLDQKKSFDDGKAMVVNRFHLKDENGNLFDNCNATGVESNLKDTDRDQDTVYVSFNNNSIRAYSTYGLPLTFDDNQWSLQTQLRPDDIFFYLSNRGLCYVNSTADKSYRFNDQWQESEQPETVQDGNIYDPFGDYYGLSDISYSKNIFPLCCSRTHKRLDFVVGPRIKMQSKPTAIYWDYAVVSGDWEKIFVALEDNTVRQIKVIIWSHESYCIDKSLYEFEASVLPPWEALHQTEGNLYRCGDGLPGVSFGFDEFPIYDENGSLIDNSYRYGYYAGRRYAIFDHLLPETMDELISGEIYCQRVMDLYIHKGFFGDSISLSDWDSFNEGPLFFIDGSDHHSNEPDNYLPGANTCVFKAGIENMPQVFIDSIKTGTRSFVYRQKDDVGNNAHSCGGLRFFLKGPNKEIQSPASNIEGICMGPHLQVGVRNKKNSYKLSLNQTAEFQTNASIPFEWEVITRDSEVGIIDSEGLFTALNPGRCQIKVTDAFGNSDVSPVICVSNSADN